MNSDFDRFLEELQRQGFTLHISPKGWTAIREDGLLVAVLWGFDDISVRHCIRIMRRHGFIWPPPRRD